MRNGLRLRAFGRARGDSGYRTSLRSHADGMEPGIDEVGPVGDRQPGTPQSEGVIPLRVQVHFGRYARALECDVIGERVKDAVDVIVLRLKQKSRRRILRDW